MPASKKSKIKTKDPEAEVKQEPVKETPVEPAVRPAMIIEPAVEEKPAEAVPVEPTVADLASVSTNEEKSDVESEPRVEKRSGRGILWMALAFILGRVWVWERASWFGKGASARKRLRWRLW